MASYDVHVDDCISAAGFHNCKYQKYTLTSFDKLQQNLSKLTLLDINSNLLKKKTKTMLTSDAILSQAMGYGYIVGLGAAFAVLMITVSYILKRYNGQVQDSETFTTAGRNCSSGLTLCCVTSSWSWPATILTSSAWSYSYSFGNYLYSMAGSVQIVLFCFLCIKIKLKCPGTHTISEIVKIRFGKTAHLVLLSYIIATNIMVLSTLLLGGAQAFAHSTGIHVVAASFLLPLGIVAYTVSGGLKSVIICDWIHTVIIYIIIIVLCFKVYASPNSIIGSPGKMWDLLNEIQEIHPAPSADSYLTWHNPLMFLISWSVCIGGFASVFGDPSYGQKAIASSPNAVVTGYIMGAVCWMIIPIAIGLSSGLVSRVLSGTYEGFKTYPNALTEDQVSSGMTLFFAMDAILGKSGAAAGALMLFMSVTSAMSAELVAFSSVFAYDIYKSYFKPSTSGKQLIKVSHLAVVGFALFSSCLAVVFNYIGVTLGWLMSFYGIILTPEVFILVFTLFWKKTSPKAVIIGGPLGTISGIAFWIGSAYHYGGAIDKNTLFLTIPNLIGNFVSLFSTMFYMIFITYLKPENFDFDSLKDKFELGDDAVPELHKNVKSDNEDKNYLSRGLIVSSICSILIVFGGYILVPLCFYGTRYEFSRNYFIQWVVIMMIWLIFAALYIIICPIYQSRRDIHRIFSLILADIIGKRKEPVQIYTLDKISEKSSLEDKAM